MEWFEFLAALGLFFVTHSLPLRPCVKLRLQASIGKGGFTLVYSHVSLAALTWLIVASGRAPYVALWEPAAWQAWLALAFMLAASMLVVLAFGAPNPFSFGGFRKRFDVEQPGLTGWVRHPFLMAIALWSLSHLIANGNLAHVILFGIFNLFAILGMRIIDRRRKRKWGPAVWQKRWRAAHQNRSLRWLYRAGSIGRIAIGVLVYAIILELHPIIIGVSPLAMLAI